MLRGLPSCPRIFSLLGESGESVPERVLISALVLLCLLEVSHGKTHFSSLQRTIVVSTSTSKHGDVLKTGEDKITVRWGLNQTFPASTHKEYEEMKMMLCFAPISQVHRAWRKTKDDLKTDKTCQFTILKKAYDSTINNTEQSFEWLLERNVPTATYFVRVYAMNSHGHEVGYGQSTDDNKGTNLFDVEGISGRHVSLDIAAAAFSAFSVISLFGFFYAEKRKSRNAQRS